MGNDNYLKEVISFWGVCKDSKIKRVEDSKTNVFLVSNKEKKYILKKKHDYNKLKKEYDLLLYLMVEGINVQLPLLNNNGKLYYKLNDVFYFLYPYIEGEIIKDFFNSDKSKLVLNYGKAIGNMHKCLEEYNDFSYPKMNLLNDINWAFNLIEENNESFDITKLRGIVKKLETYFNNIDLNLKYHPIHRDIHSENMIVNNDVVTGFIDFEISVVGPRVFDFAYFGSSLLSKIYIDKEKSQEWYILMKYFYSGYNEVNPLTKDEIISIWYIYLAIEIIFIGYFIESKNIKLSKATEDLLYYIYENKNRFSKTFKE